MDTIDHTPIPFVMGLKQFLSKGKEQGSFRDYLIKGTLGFFVLQILSAGLGFLTNILLARFLGAAQYGVYTYIFAWVGAFTILAMSGFGSVLIRDIASYVTSESWGLVKGILYYVSAHTTILAICIVALATMAVWLFRDALNPAIFPAVWLALLFIPFSAISSLNSLAMQGFKRAVLGRVSPVLIQGPLFVFLILVANWIKPQGFAAIDAIGLHLIAVIAAVVVGLGLLRRILPAQVVKHEPEYQRGIWLRSAAPLLLVAVLFEINNRAPVIMLGTLAGLKEAGIYAVASLITGFIGLILVSANAALGPVISSLYVTGEMVRLQKIVTRSARITFLIALLIAASIIVFRQWIPFVFGQEFEYSGTAVIILSIGQLLNVAAGSVAFLFVMTGHERYTVSAIAVSSLTTVALNAFLIPRWGIEGAAVATSISLLVWNLILIVQVRRRLGIDSTVFGLMVPH
jgi:O-antigen/teichoic acid export membrane protein